MDVHGTVSTGSTMHEPVSGRRPRPVEVRHAGSGHSPADKTIHRYHHAAAELWKFCFARGGGAHAEFVAGLLDRMTADAETIDWWERAIPRRHQ